MIFAVIINIFFRNLIFLGIDSHEISHGLLDFLNLSNKEGNKYFIMFEPGTLP